MSEQRAQEPIEIGLADSNPLMLGALSEFFERDPRFSLVATSKTAEGFLEVILRASLSVGIIDWTLPMLGGEKLLEIVRAQAAAPRMIVYSHDRDTDVVRRAMAAGAAGFCARSEPPERLLDIVAEVADGRMVFPFLDVRKLRQDPMDALTERERVLIGLLAKGHSNKALARELGISVNTVKFHLRNLFEKLSVNSRSQAIALYYTSSSAGIVVPEISVEAVRTRGGHPVEDLANSREGRITRGSAGDSPSEADLRTSSTHRSSVDKCLETRKMRR